MNKHEIGSVIYYYDPAHKTARLCKIAGYIERRDANYLVDFLGADKTMSNKWVRSEHLFKNNAHLVDYFKDLQRKQLIEIEEKVRKLNQTIV